MQAHLPPLRRAGLHAVLALALALPQGRACAAEPLVPAAAATRPLVSSELITPSPRVDATSAVDGAFSFAELHLDAAPASSPAPTPTKLAPVAPYWSPASATVSSVPADAGGDASSASKVSPREASRSGDQSPSVLGRPLDPSEALAEPEPLATPLPEFVDYPRDPPLGYSGPSGVLPTESQQTPDFLPIEDRWRIGFPYWDRYDKGQTPNEDYPYDLGRLVDPYDQNVLKGDYPIIGQHTFFNVTAQSFSISEYRQVPTATTPFESTVNPFEEEFFGRPDQFFFSQYLRTQFDLFHGNAAFKPVDWRLRLEPIFNVNTLSTRELGVVYPDVRRGTGRTRSDMSLEQWFIEKKLADIGPDYDFISVRAGSQPFISDFRGFVFNDVNRGVRLFGTRFANRDQFNLFWVDQTEKDTNSLLNTFNDRHQNTVIANYFRQDFVFPGFTGLVNFHYNRDGPSTKFDDNGFLVRPDPSGVFQPHEVESYYIGVGTDGHIGRVNVVSQFYQVLGRDSMNPIAGCAQNINAQMAALELSVDRDWIRFRTSYFFASGDTNPHDNEARGFDTIFDNPNFAGGEFSYWQRQALQLFGVNLVQRFSLVPDLRSSKTQGQSNFVNPGLHLANIGMDFDVTPKLRAIANANYLWFADTAVLEAFTFQSNIADEIGADLSLGFEYRPLQSDNIIANVGYAILLPGAGLDDLFGKTDPFTLPNAQHGPVKASAMNQLFLQLALTY